MDLQDCIKFANENPICHIATVDGDQPRVRVFLMWYANENGFYFVGMTPKACSKQMHRNPRVEVCFYNNPPDLQNAKMVRVTGEVEFLDDEKLIEKIAEERSFLSQIIGKPVKPYLEVFRIHSGEAYFWTMADIMKEFELERIKF